MKYNPAIHHRRSIRLKGYDYSQHGVYFITVCAQNRECFFGEIVDDGKGTMYCSPTEFGQIAINEWFKTVEMRKNIELDAFVLMPNHIHGILVINDHDIRRGTVHRAPTFEQFGKPTSNTIPTIIRGYKSTVTKQINTLRNTPAAPVWQRNFYEHIIRSERELTRIREYIMNNPINWDSDRNNPENLDRGIAASPEPSVHLRD